jgi:hypothetical protein
VILLVILGLISGAGAYAVFGKIRARTETLTSQIESLEEEIGGLREQAEEYQRLAEELGTLETGAVELAKVIPAEESSYTSYAYFDRIAQEASGIIYFDYALLERGQEKSFNTSLYLLTGSATFNGLSQFIQALEHWPLFYKIERLDLQSSTFEDQYREDLTWKGVDFTMEVRAYSDPSATDAAERLAAAEYEPLKRATYNPFYPLIEAEIPPNEEDLLEVDGSVLKAIAGNRAFLQDQHGKLVSLGLGDRVYLGYLTRIDPLSGECTFTLNKGGWVEQKVLQIETLAERAAARPADGKGGRQS